MLLGELKEPGALGIESWSCSKYPLVSSVSSSCHGTYKMDDWVSGPAEKSGGFAVEKGEHPSHSLSAGILREGNVTMKSFISRKERPRSRREGHK